MGLLYKGARIPNSNHFAVESNDKRFTGYKTNVENTFLLFSYEKLTISFSREELDVIFINYRKSYDCKV